VKERTLNYFKDLVSSRNLKLEPSTYIIDDLIGFREIDLSKPKVFLIPVLSTHLIINSIFINTPTISQASVNHVGYFQQ